MQSSFLGVQESSSWKTKRHQLWWWTVTCLPCWLAHAHTDVLHCTGGDSLWAYNDRALGERSNLFSPQPIFWGVWTKCTVLVIQHHCCQTFSTHLGGGEGRSPVWRGCGAQPRDFFLMIFCQFLETNSWSLKTEFLEIRNFWLRVIGSCMSHREIKIDVWKYIRLILMGLVAVLAVKKTTSQNLWPG